jgi:hypothetical protein
MTSRDVLYMLAALSRTLARHGRSALFLALPRKPAWWHATSRKPLAIVEVPIFKTEPTFGAASLKTKDVFAGRFFPELRHPGPPENRRDPQRQRVLRRWNWKE